MHTSYSIILALIAVSTAQPVPLPSNSVSNSQVDPSKVLDQIEHLFEQTCHNTCLQLFPEESPDQDYCMDICHHRHPDSSHNSTDLSM
ncbi:hypothetical protein F4677DRAFT_422991 [Hypoxylon crocopeplum]|nr:hypothetical protein F4677DRAFT_422991 [Hypoxylon crocopeplum]